MYAVLAMIVVFLLGMALGCFIGYKIAVGDEEKGELKVNE